MKDEPKNIPDYERLLSDEELALAIRRRKEGMNLHAIEGNPLSADEIAMFEMFERERWSHERRRAYIFQQLQIEASARKT